MALKGEEKSFGAVLSAASLQHAEARECARGSAFVKEGFRMFMPPSCASLAIFANKNSKTHAGATVTILACRTIFHQPIAQFVVISWRRWGSNRDGLGRRACTILWRNNEPSSIRALLITSVLIVSIATRPRLSLCCNHCAGGAANDRTNCRSATAAYRAAQYGPGSATQDCAADCVLRGGILHWHRQRNGQKG
jgi:hypothetical protein